MTQKQRITNLKQKVRTIDKELASGAVTHDRMLTLKDRRIAAIRELLVLDKQNISDTNIGVGGSSVYQSYQQGYGYKGKKI